MLWFGKSVDFRISDHLGGMLTLVAGTRPAV